jgi:hypothetical protein
MEFWRNHWHHIIEAPEEGEGSGGGAPDSKTDDEAPDEEDEEESEEEDEDEEEEETITLTKSELAQKIKSAKAQARRSAERKKSSEEAKKPEKKEDTSTTRDLEEAYARRVVRNEAKSVARDLGVRPERVQAVLSLTSLKGIDLDEDDEPDYDELKERLEETLEKYPEFKSTTKEKKKDVGSGKKPSDSKEPKQPMSFLEAMKADKKGK